MLKCDCAAELFIGLTVEALPQVAGWAVPEGQSDACVCVTAARSEGLGANCKDARLKEIQVNFALREARLWRKKGSGRQVGLTIS